MNIDFITDINKGLEDSLNYKKVDNFIVKILWWHLGVFALVAFLNAVVKLASFYPSPLAWRVISIPEAIVTVLIAAMATLITTLLKGNIQNHYLWRIVVTVAIVIYSYLFVFISGGSIEMHFHFFIVAALLIIFADWRLGWILLVLTALHHGILNYIQPGWVYYYGRNDLSVIAHALPVLAAVIFTTIISINSRETVFNLQEATTRLDNLALKEDLEALRLALDKSALFSATYRKGDIYYANDKFVEVSKYSREELIGQNHRILKSGFHSPEFYKELWDTISSGKVWHGEIKNRAKDGSFYWVNSTLVPIMGPDNKPKRYIAVRIPITEQKESQEQLLKKNQELEKMNKLMVGRELAMAELKKKIKALEQGLKVQDTSDTLPAKES
ncbi:MAG: PAS domain S-box protein [Patescibacteria group bacterium]